MKGAFEVSLPFTTKLGACAFIAAAAALGSNTNIVAQGFPSKPVRLVVPFAAGGSNDVVARGMAQPLGRALGQSIIIENRPGANTILGTEAVARAPADGHTVLIVGFTFMSNAALRSKLPYDPHRDFVPVAGLGFQPYVLSVHPSLPVKSVKELVALARARPGELVYAMTGYGTGQHLSGELLKLKAKVDIKPVAFQGGAPATVAVLGGHATILFSTAPPIVQHISSGKLRPLAVTSRTRTELLKHVPTMIESGLPDFDMTGGMGVFAPSASPKEAVERLSAEIVRTLQNPEVRDGLVRDGFTVAPMGTAEYQQYVRTRMQQIQKVAREANIKVD
ncbi:MAG: Bug family tripartite tricarboxylate transporter substrate binding protein [Burkholderiales bacterium]